MTKRPGDFSDAAKITIAERAGYQCSNPTCGKPTSRPDPRDPNRAVQHGVAAHIVSAGDSGPRSDPSMDPSARASVSNGIWLCNSCSRVIDDSADDTYTPELLHHWQDQAAERTARKARANPETVERLLNSIEATRVAIYGQIAEWRELDPFRDDILNPFDDREKFFLKSVEFGEMRQKTFELDVAPAVASLLAGARTILLPDDPVVSRVEFESEHAYVNDIGMERLAQHLRDLAAALTLW